METILIEVTSIIDSKHCILADDGARVASATRDALASGANVTLSFSAVRMLTSPFVRALFVPLLEQFPAEQLRTHLHLTELAAGDRARIKFIVDDLKLRLHDPEAYDRARQHALELA